MLWVWCGSSHKTPGCTLVCITLVLGSWQGSLVVGCVRSTTCSEVPATWVLRRWGVGGPAILEYPYGGGSELKPFTPCNLLTYLPLLEDGFFFLSKGRYPFSSFERGIIHEICNTLLISYYLPRERYFTIHFSIIPLTHCPLVTGTSYYLLNNTKIR